MPHTIVLSDATFELLQRIARPLLDTPDSIIADAAQKVLDDKQRSTIEPPDAPKSAKRRSGRNHHLPGKAFREPLITTMYQLGGCAEPKKIKALMERIHAATLGAGERECVSNGTPRWWKMTEWEAHKFRRNGMFKSEQRGLWELSEKGIQYAERIVR